MSILDTIPGLAGYNAQRQFNDQANLDQLKMASGGLGVLQSIVAQHQQQQLRDAAANSGGDIEKVINSALQSGNIDAAAKLKPLLELQRQKQLTDQLNSGGLDSLTPDKLDMLAQSMAVQGHPGAGAVAALADKRRALKMSQDQLPLIRSQDQGGLDSGQTVTAGGKTFAVDASIPPEEVAAALKVATANGPATVAPKAGDVSPLRSGGLFDALANSEYPAIAARAKFLQSQVNNPSFQPTPEVTAKLQQYAEDLSKQVDSLNQQKNIAGQRSADVRRGQDLATQRVYLSNGLNPDGTLTPESEQLAQGIAAGRLPPLSGFALNRPGGRAVMSRVVQIKPDYNAQDYTVSLGTEKAFTSGKQGQTIQSFNVALQHLDQLGEAASALENGDFQGFNKAANFYASQTGQPAPNSFNAIKQIVGDEIVKAIVGSGGGVADREKAQKTVSDANSPAQLADVIQQYKGLMVGQLNGLYKRYQAGGGKKDFNGFLTEQAQQEATKHGADFGGGGGGWSIRPKQ